MIKNPRPDTSVIPLIVAAFLPLIVAAPLIMINVNLYRPPVHVSDSCIDARLLRQLDYLDWSIAHDGPEMMQRIFPEGAFFMHSLHTLSWIEVARRSHNDSALFTKAVQKAKIGIGAMTADLGPFDDLKYLSPRYGVFFTGWLNWTRGALLSLGIKDSGMRVLENDFTNSCEEIARAFDTSATPFLESYSQMTWPSDNIVSIASLRLYDHLYGAKYAATIARWLGMLKSRLDPETGMIPYQTEPRSGACLEGPEGNSQAVIIRFLAELDPGMAAEQYRLYAAGFPVRRLGLSLVKEYPGRKRGLGNIDAGPVIWGIGSAATIVAPAAMRLFRDTGIAVRTEQNIDALGFPMTIGGKTRYALGLMPMADAFLVWSKLVMPYTQTIPPLQLSGPDPLWRIPFHLFSLFLYILFCLPACRIFLKMKKGKIVPHS